MTQRENPQLRLLSLQVGDQLYRFKQYQLSLSHLGNLALQPIPAVEFELIERPQIDSIEADPETQVYNLLLDGNRSYIADDYLAHNKGGDDNRDHNNSHDDDNHSSNDFSPSGSDMSRDEEAAAIANGWK